MSLDHSKDDSSIKHEDSIADLQVSIRALVNERRELQARLGGNHDLRWGGYDHRQNEFFSRNTFARESKRLRPTTTNTENHDISGGNNNDVISGGKPTLTATGVLSTNTETESVVFPVEKRPKVCLDDSTIKRTKNMFVSLLGHLQKAKSRLDNEKTQKPAELQRAAAEQVAHMLELERKNLAELRRRDFQERQKRDIARMRELQKELRIKEAKILELHLQNHFTVMKNFIRTDVTPMIFWVPAQHNDETRRLQEQTKEQIERKLQSLTEKFAQLIEEKWPSNHAEVDIHVEQCVEEHEEPSAQLHPDLIHESDDDDDDDDDERENNMNDANRTDEDSHVSLNGGDTDRHSSQENNNNADQNLNEYEENNNNFNEGDNKNTIENDDENSNNEDNSNNENIDDCNYNNNKKD